MPKFLNASGDYCHGEGLASGGVTAINKIPVLGPTTTATRALNADEAICQLNGAQLWAVAKNGRSRLIDTQGANYLYARGNRWGAQLDIDGVATFRTGVNGSITPVALPIIGVGWGGQLMTKANPGAGLIVGGIPLSNGVVEDQQASADGKVIWREGFAVRTHGMAAPRRMPNEFYWLAHTTVLGEEWIAYQDGWRVVARKVDDETSGYILPTSAVYGLEIIADGELLRFVWGIRSGEQPSDIEARVISVHQPRVQLLTPTGGGDPIHIPDPPNPEHPVYQRISPDYSAHVAQVAAMFPVEWDRANKEKYGSRTPEFIHLLASYMNAKVDPRIGNNGKRGTEEESLDALAFKNPTAPGGAEVIDVIIGAGHKATWSDATIPPMPHPQGRADVPDGVLGKFIQPAPWVEGGSQAPATHAYDGGEHDTGECDVILPSGAVCRQPKSAAIHDVDDHEPGPVDPPLRSELKPALAMLASIGIDLLATQRQLRQLPVPPPVIKEVIKEVIVEKGVDRPHPEYGQVLDLAAAVDAEYRRAQKIRNPRPLSPDTMAHLLWRYAFEDYTVDQLVQEARERAGG